VKTATITYHSAHNFGAVLQAYALQQKLIQLGYENEIINLRTKQSIVAYKIFKPIKNIKALLVNLISFLKYFSLSRGYVRFELFIDEMQKTKLFHTYEELVQNPPKADVYICGSDQIWNVTNFVNKAFFLRFGTKGVKKISYAASLGTSTIKEDKKDVFREMLSGIDCVGVRETTAKYLLKNEYNIDAQVNIDPVFLLSKDKWQLISKKPNIKKPYLLVYSLYNPPLLNKTLKAIKELYNLEVVVISSLGVTKVYYDTLICDAGPEEFLGLIENATAVVASSFHGTAFSVILEKPFLSVVNPVLGSRIVDLLETLGLKDRVLNDINDINRLFNVDFTASNSIILEETENAVGYLKTSIDGESV
jgi:hypothetical protein